MSLNQWEQQVDDGYWRAILNEEESSPSSSRKTGSEQGPDNSYDGKKGSNPYKSDWDKVEEMFNKQQVVELRVTGYNRGGLLVNLYSLQGFVPASQLLELPKHTNAIARQAELSEKVGRRLRLCIIETDPSRNRLILSERVAADGSDSLSLLDSLKEGDVYRGTVTSVCGFGAFVDLGGIEGLVHISEISWGRVAHPGDLLKVGDDVEVYVLSVEHEQQRVALSIKRLIPDPWKSVTENYSVNQLVEGVITNVVSFGAFARIEEGLEGLIHISELAEGNFLHPRNVVKEGDRVVARILNIDPKNHRLGLSLRRVGTETGD